jgi:hypothetical protein
MQRGSGSYTVIGGATTDGSYELSYNFNTDKSWCFIAELVPQPGSFNASYNMGVILENET